MIRLSKIKNKGTRVGMTEKLKEKLKGEKRDIPQNAEEIIRQNTISEDKIAED